MRGLLRLLAHRPGPRDHDQRQGEQLAERELLAQRGEADERAHGRVRTTDRAVKDGYWRWRFTGTHTTGTAKATGDYVDVRP
ncbi:hypothetical protein [Streptomyces sp. NPDC057877]|uniref:hypothetical protein n=1 Tax=Streptomyces sp. NPDC057877 TaxID=3346269 RepID=UPI0036B7D9FE